MLALVFVYVMSMYWSVRSAMPDGRVGSVAGLGANPVKGGC